MNTTPKARENAERVLNYEEYDFNYTDLLDEALILARAYLELEKKFNEASNKYLHLAGKNFDYISEITKLKEELERQHNIILNLNNKIYRLLNK